MRTDTPARRHDTSIHVNHETIIQQLRHERSTELQRLDHLKKGLQSKLDVKSDPPKVHAA